jgi:SAM-dependent methyltransferase
MDRRKRARELARQFLDRNDPTGWFEPLYIEAGGDFDKIPWADQTVNANLLAWLERNLLEGSGKRALVVGCGLGDDAEELARRGLAVTAFDVSPTAIEWCKRRFPKSSVHYIIADLHAPPESWLAGFDFVFEAYTLQTQPAKGRARAIDRLASLVAPGGFLLVICRARNHDEELADMPWPLSREELGRLEDRGLRLVHWEDFMEDRPNEPTRRFRALYQAAPFSHSSSEAKL